MGFQAFEWVRDTLQPEFEKQGFAGPEELHTELGQGEMYRTDEVAYGIFFDPKKQRFQLCSATLNGEKAPETWRSLSTWMFDPETGEKADAVSIANDFLEIIQGPKRVALVQKKAKKGKSDGRSVDANFFMNRLANLLPAVKEALKEERIRYGRVRFVMLTKEKILPQIEDIARRYPDSDVCGKLCALFSDMYRDGDLDLRSLVTITMLNGLSEEAYLALRDQLSDELQTDTRYTRKLIGKKIKPEKPKKEKKVVARLGD